MGAFFCKYLIQNGAHAGDRKYLLHDAANANYDNLDKVLLLIHSAKLDPSQSNAEGMTLLHVAADGKPPKIDLLVLALEKGVNPNNQDVHEEDTALHKVTKNYTERTVPWKESERAMKLLLQDPKTNPNIRNAQGLTPFGILVRNQILVIQNTGEQRFDCRRELEALFLFLYFGCGSKKQPISQLAVMKEGSTSPHLQKLAEDLTATF